MAKQNKVKKRRPPSRVTEEPLPAYQNVASGNRELVFLWDTTNLFYELARTEEHEPGITSPSTNFSLCEFAPILHLGLTLILKVGEDHLTKGIEAMEAAYAHDPPIDVGAMDKDCEQWVLMMLASRWRIEWLQEQGLVEDQEPAKPCPNALAIATRSCLVHMQTLTDQENIPGYQPSSTPLDTLKGIRNIWAMLEIASTHWPDHTVIAIEDCIAQRLGMERRIDLARSNNHPIVRAPT